ncbi:hypothetical protein [Streptomyces sp. NBC_01579]|uniref:hypothetical protein n=1 Tax=Streptomyces sp. NBC_01579 TaxID=2975885 RepID=UPI00386AA8EE
METSLAPGAWPSIRPPKQPVGGRDAGHVGAVGLVEGVDVDADGFVAEALGLDGEGLALVDRGLRVVMTDVADLVVDPVAPVQLVVGEHVVLVEVHPDRMVGVPVGDAEPP